MSFPTPYTRQFDFQSYQNANPTRPLPGDKVNADLNAAGISTDEIVDFLKGFTRADGKLANASVGVDQLDASLKIGFSLPTTWEPGVAYAATSTVFSQGIFYSAKLAHTSGLTFDASKWNLLVDFLQGLQVTQLNVPQTWTASQSFSNAQILGWVGAVGTPGFAFNGDADTGIYSTVANTLDFAAGGTRVASANVNGFAVLSGQLLPLVGAVGAPGLAWGTAGLYSTGAGNVDVAAAGVRVMNFNNSGPTVYDTFKLFRTTGAPTVQQSALFGFRMISGTTDNAKAAAGGFRIDNNTAAAGDFSTTFPLYFVVQNYSQAFNAGIFHNPSLVPLGDDSTHVWWGENFTLNCTHTLSQDRPQAHVSVMSGGPSGSVTTVVLDAQPPYTYANNQTGIQVVIFEGPGYVRNTTVWASADGTGALKAPNTWTVNADGTGGAAFPTAYGAFQNTPSI
ncbi:MAG TPA: hypothetical protein VK137_14360, partial [Planctomycetaceae bacterium]|nr:hypothetical protein [Planctomycetaceae bacterium]